ncbi:hypothetical protein [Streptomyces anandii]|nr:hypothetical protein [Streptomyces anandii]
MSALNEMRNRREERLPGLLARYDVPGAAVAGDLAGEAAPTPAVCS